jgi:pimeloyl-ACP methyl ester carboxylesterase
MRLLLLTAVGLVALYAGALLLLWRFQEQVVFQPPRFASAARVAARQVRYATSDGIELFAYVVGSCTPQATVVLAFHGNADVSRWLVPWASELANRTGACVVLPEYRGYDGLPGVPTYAASANDARAALEYVRDSLGVQPGRLVYFGHSLGTAIATELAGSEAPRALVLQSPFSSARAMAARMIVPGLTLFWSMISRVHFDTIARVRTLEAPVWVAHGDRDVIIPVRMGREVFDAARVKGELLIVAGAGHNDVPVVGGAAYWSWLSRAIGDDASSDVSPAARAGR